MGMRMWFPTRHLTTDALPLLSTDIILNDKDINSTVKVYTSYENNIHSVSNIILTMHITNDIDNGIDSLKGATRFIKNLNAAICQKADNDKSKGLIVYCGATLSALGLCMMKLQKTFFLPTFFLTSSTEGTCCWEPYKDQNGGIHNVKFVINLSEYWSRAIVINDTQTEYSQEKEVLLSCYNLYEYEQDKYNEANNTLYVHLKVKNNFEYKPEKMDFRSKPENTLNYDEWMSSRTGEIHRITEITCKQLYDQCNNLLERINKNFTIEHGNQHKDDPKEATKTTAPSKPIISQQHKIVNEINKKPEYNRRYPLCTLIFMSGIAAIVALSLFLKKGGYAL